MEINPTQIAGVTSFALASVLCAAAARGRAQKYVYHWLIVASIYAGLSLEIAVGIRYGIHDFFGSILRQTGRYEDRADLQIFLLITLSIISVTFCIVKRQCLSAVARETRAASAAGAIAVTLILVEGVSLHSIDAIFWQTILGLKVIGWLWLILASVGVGAAVVTLTRKVR